MDDFNYINGRRQNEDQEWTISGNFWTLSFGMFLNNLRGESLQKGVQNVLAWVWLDIR